MVRHLSRRNSAVTVVEVLVNVSILMLLMLVISSVINVTGKVWKSTSGKIEGFQASRAAFDTMTRKLGQATLNSYYDYFDSNGRSASDAGYSGIPARYGRQSELHFKTGKSILPAQVGQAVFFQTPAGESGKTYGALNELLNACGYFIRFGSDSSANSLSGRPAFLDEEKVSLKYRFRLMELSQPAEELKIYDPNSGASDWYSAPLAKSPPLIREVAENVIALVVLPKKPDWEEKQDDARGLVRIGNEYEYDSRGSWNGGDQPLSMNQLPPLLQVVMVAIDEVSAKRLQGSATTAPDLGISGNLFQKAERIDADLATLERKLQEKHLNYRIYQTEIPLRGSRWSEM